MIRHGFRLIRPLSTAVFKMVRISRYGFAVRSLRAAFSQERRAPRPDRPGRQLGQFDMSEERFDVVTSQAPVLLAGPSTEPVLRHPSIAGEAGFLITPHRHIGG